MMFIKILPAISLQEFTRLKNQSHSLSSHCTFIERNRTSRVENFKDIVGTKIIYLSIAELNYQLNVKLCFPL